MYIFHFSPPSVNTPDYETVEESGRTRRRAVFSTKLPETGHKEVESGSDDNMSDDEEIDMSRVMPLNQVRDAPVINFTLHMYYVNRFRQ